MPQAPALRPGIQPRLLSHPVTRSRSYLRFPVTRTLSGGAPISRMRRASSSDFINRIRLVLKDPAQYRASPAVISKGGRRDAPIDQDHGNVSLPRLMHHIGPDFRIDDDYHGRLYAVEHTLGYPGEVDRKENVFASPYTEKRCFAMDWPVLVTVENTKRAWGNLAWNR